MRDWARASGGLVRVAVVTTAEMIDPSRFGVTVATNAGMAADVFVDEEAAREWLVGRKFGEAFPGVLCVELFPKVVLL